MVHTSVVIVNMIEECAFLSWLNIISCCFTFNDTFYFFSRTLNSPLVKKLLAKPLLPHRSLLEGSVLKRRRRVSLGVREGVKHVGEIMEDSVDLSFQDWLSKCIAVIFMPALAHLSGTTCLVPQ